MLDRLEDDAKLDDHLDELLDFTGAGWALMVALFLAKGEGVPVHVASEMIREAATDELEPDQAQEAWQAWTQAHGDPAEYLLGMLEELGAVLLPDQPPDESEDGPVARLTPLGTWAMWELLSGDGVGIPLLPPSDQMTAADLVAAAEGLDDEEFEAETAAWLQRRAPDAAASELLAAAADGGPAGRLLAIATAQKLGAAGDQADVCPADPTRDVGRGQVAAEAAWPPAVPVKAVRAAPLAAIGAGFVAWP